MDYSLITGEMVWSYSRINTFLDCPHKFVLKYINGERGDKMFFSSYGSLVHSILEKFFKGEIPKDKLTTDFITRYYSEVVGEPPTSKVFSNYFTQGVEYFNNTQLPEGKILGVEKKAEFKIGKYPFVGIIDLLLQDGEDYKVVDNKSKALKGRGLKKPTVGDKELDEYLRQLYLYSIPVEQEYGKLPKQLVFNCFRTQRIISDPFSPYKFEEAKKWAVDTIAKINREQDWNPVIDDFKCRYICDVSDKCEYYQMYKN